MPFKGTNKGPQKPAGKESLVRMSFMNIPDHNMKLRYDACDVNRGINLAVDAVVAHLKSRAKMIGTTEEIAQVGTISANGEGEIGDLIARAMEKVGKEGVITVSDGKTLYNELEVAEGMKLERGYISLYFITNVKSQRVELENPVILIHEKKISGLSSILPLLEMVV